MASDNCDHGDWVDGVCICDEGYVSEFTNKELYPVYCAKKYEEVTVVLKGNEIRHLLQYLAISATIFLVISGVLVYVYFVYTIFDSWLLSLKIASAKRKLEEFRSNLLRRAPDENLNAELWYPDMNKYICVNDPNFSEEKAPKHDFDTSEPHTMEVLGMLWELLLKTKQHSGANFMKLVHAFTVWTKMEKQMKIMCSTVMHDYKPEKDEELRLKVGDIITHVEKMNKGWCKGKLDGKTGYYPEAYAEMFETMADADGKPILGLDQYYGGYPQYYDPMGMPLGGGDGGEHAGGYYMDPYYQQMIGAGFSEEQYLQGMQEGYPGDDYQQFLQQGGAAAAGGYGDYHQQYIDAMSTGGGWESHADKKQK